MVRNNEQPVAVVINAAPMGWALHLYEGIAAAEPSTKMPFAGNLGTLVYLEEDLHSGIVLRDIDNWVLRQNAAHVVFKIFPLRLTVEIVEHQEPAAEKVLSQTRDFRVTGVPVSRLLEPDERILEEAFVGQLKMPGVFGDVDTGIASQC